MHLFRKFSILTLIGILSLCLAACERKKQAEVIITEQEFVLRQDKEHSFIVDARGKLRNVGEVDLRNVVVTGDCDSCSDVWVVDQWLVSVAEKMPEQKSVIPYLSVGEEAEFGFKEIANMYRQGSGSPALPDQLKIVIESFEPAGK
jgi:hypothetical protein